MAMARQSANGRDDVFDISMRRADMTAVPFSTLRPVSLQYLANLSVDVLKITLIVLITIEALFVSDVIVSRVLPEMLAFGSQLSTIGMVVIYAAPNGMFIALPAALLIGVYTVVLRRREEHAFKIFAGMGYSPRILNVTAVTIGLLGAVVSLVFSGFVEPNARTLLTSTLQGAAHEAIRDGKLTSGRFYHVADTTIYAASGRTNKVAGDVFLYQKTPGDRARVIIANRSFNLQTDKKDRFGVLFNDANIYELADQAGAGDSQKQKQVGRDCVGCEADGSFPSLQHMHFDKFYMELPKEDFAQAHRLRGPEDANFIEMFSQSEWDSRYVQVFGERLMRAALCLITPLMGLVAVALTFRATLLLALPAACAVVLFFSFFASNCVGLISKYGAFTTAAGILVGAIGISGLFILLVNRLNSNFVRTIRVSV